ERWSQRIDAPSLGDDLFVAVQHAEERKVRTADSMIIFGFGAVSNGPVLINVPANKMFLVKISLSGTNSISLPKTALGKTYGKDFEKVRESYPTKPSRLLQATRLFCTILGLEGAQKLGSPFTAMKLRYPSAEPEVISTYFLLAC